MQNGSSFDPHSLSAPRSSPPSLLLPLLLFWVLLAKRTVAGSVSSDDFFFRCPIFQRTVCWLPSSSTTTVPTPGVASRSTIFPLPAKRTLACLTNDVSNAERTSAQVEALAGFQALVYHPYLSREPQKKPGAGRLIVVFSLASQYSNVPGSASSTLSWINICAFDIVDDDAPQIAQSARPSFVILKCNPGVMHIKNTPLI